MNELNNWAYAYGKPESSALLKDTPADFKVDEQLGFELTGSGEHHFFLIEKKNLTTEMLVKELAHTLNVAPKYISYAGLKDRQAITTQWLSVHLPGQEIAHANGLKGNQWQVLTYKKHIKKLKIGTLLGNHFQIILKNVSAPDALAARLNLIKHQGVPNYFGEQRFGYLGQNMVKAKQLLQGDIKVKNPFLRGLYLSAARAFLFNHILSARINAGNWQQAIPGDVLQLSGTHSIFAPLDIDETLRRRVSDLDISPVASLWGKGALRMKGQALEIQSNALAPYQDWCAGLVKYHLEHAYRALVLPISTLEDSWLDETTLKLNFFLGRGSYATTVIRELVQSPISA